MRYLAAIAFSVSCACTSSNAQNSPIVFRSAEDERAILHRSEAENDIKPAQLPEIAFPIVLQPRVKSMAPKQDVYKGIVASINAREFLFERENLAVRVDAPAGMLSRETPERSLSPEALQAIGQSPSWLEDALRMKFILLAARRLDAAFAQLVIGAGEHLKDEVAFVIAHSSLQTLTDSRFAQDRGMIVRNAEMIYKYADSLTYVRLVEHGAPGSRDGYTTAEYRVYDPAAQDTIWSEIPRDIYYWYVVHPKMDQEGVYVRDNFNDNSGQRTYGYAWRDYIWNNPDPVYDYQPVNITTSKGTVTSIQRFGELMQTPTYLWDRRKTYLPFNRPFLPGQSALDVLGNWASRALPVDVALPRAFQPNQILMKHNGMCNEDAFLVAGACRTALIPVVYAGCYAEDHVFGMVWDQGWHHFEFFRGGLSPGGNQFYGITNMLDRGSYGWKISMVEATRPDGYPMNFTEHYTNTCDVELVVRDSLGAPMEGVMVQVYAPYGNGYGICRRMYTGADGKLIFEAGEQKRYLVNAFHPYFGWSPADSTRAYYLTSANTAAGQKYSLTVTFPNVKTARKTPHIVPPNGPFDAAIRLRARVRDIRSGVNPHDGQRSRFHERDSTGGGLISVTLMDRENYEAFSAGNAYTALAYQPSLLSGEWFADIPADKVYYVVLGNEATANLFSDVQIECELLDEAISGAYTPHTAHALNTWPNPASGSFRISTGDGKPGRFRLYNPLGVLVSDAYVTDGALLDVSSLPDGIYAARMGDYGSKARMIVIRKGERRQAVSR